MEDKADKNPAYLKNHDFTAWHSEIHPYLKSLSPSQLPSGLVVELGVHRGLSSQVLKKQFGSHRYVGVDKHPFTSDPRVIKKDIRDLQNFPQKAALVWNDISTWEGSPRSRLAALKWAQRNLKKGGLYIDEGVSKIPSDLNYSAFEQVFASKNFTVFRKKV